MTHARRAVLAAGVLGALALTTLPALAAPAKGPAVRLFSPDRTVTMTVHHPDPRDEEGEDWVELNPVVYLESPRNRLELDVRRLGAGEPVVASVLVGGKRYPVSSALLDGWRGLKDAFTLTWSTVGGKVLGRTKQSWCPNDSQPSRLGPKAATETVFTTGCSTHPFTRSQRWGIDRGWARQVLGYGITPPAGPLPSKIVLDVTLRKGLADTLRVPAGVARVRFLVTVTEVTDDNGEEEPPEPGPWPWPSGRAMLRSASVGAGGHGPDEPTSPGPKKHRHFKKDVLPDLVSLPAFGMSTHTEDGRDQLDFAATVYNGGRGPLVAEGFRRGEAEVMAAYQFFYRGTKQVGSARVGSMEYDRRESHQHWHFRDFAVYDLVNSKKQRLRTSGKEAFCLAPTDAIDLLQPGAVVNPGNGDLGTACGDESSVWVREVLAAGWGDTYTQARAGQSIDITGLVNGTYWVRVTANPGNRLYERTRKNNVAYRRVVLGGRPGDRTVTVPKVGLIDSETGYGGEPGPGGPID